MVYLLRLVRFVLLMAAIVAVLTASLAYAGPQVAKLVGAHTSDHERLSLKPLAERSYIYDSQGNLQGTLINGENENRVQVSLDKVPQTVIGSVLAAEDENFYRHRGVNIRSIGRAVDANLGSGSASQGGSTITQQVVKNSLVGNKQNLTRKIREAFLAVELENQMKERYCPHPVKADCTKGKDKILERYLNSVYFGGGAYGVQAASEYYFNKDVGKLDWAEGALLASLIRSPSTYDPFKNPKLALKRRHIVLERLVATKRITQAQADLLNFVPLPKVPHAPPPPKDYFVEEVKQQLLDDPTFNLGATPAARNHTVFEGGIHVYTTLDPNAQTQATIARDTTLPNNQGDGTFPVNNPKTGQPTFGTEAIASVEPSTGAVRAMIGGPGFKRYQFNLATHLPGRQPGSSMKTFVLATLFENGYVPSDTVNGGRCAFKFKGVDKLYTPATGRGGVATITQQTQRSSNCAFVRLGQLVGIDKVINMAQRLGIRSPLENVASLPLGTLDVTPIDMAAAYATFANDGMHNDPYYIEKITDRDGNVIYQHQAKPQRVVDVQTARLVTQVLEANVRGGTGTRAQIDNGQPAAGKTGTTNESSDVWFVGFTPQLATAIWMGAPAGRISLSNAGLGGATGGKFPAYTWGRYYSALLAGQPIVDFTAPDPTRRGRSVGKIPNEIGGYSSSGSGSTGGGTTGGGTTGGGTTGGGTTGTTVPLGGGTTVPTVTTIPGFGGGPGTTTPGGP